MPENIMYTFSNYWYLEKCWYIEIKSKVNLLMDFENFIITCISSKLSPSHFNSYYSQSRVWSVSSSGEMIDWRDVTNTFGARLDSYYKLV